MKRILLTTMVVLEAFAANAQQQWIDNINLLYVAFTRPKANLYIIGKCPAKKNEHTSGSQTVVTLDCHETSKTTSCDIPAHGHGTVFANGECSFFQDEEEEN